MKHILKLSCLLLVLLGASHVYADVLFTGETIMTSDNEEYRRAVWKKFRDDKSGLYRVRLSIEEYEWKGKTRRSLVAKYHKINEEAAFGNIEESERLGPEPERLADYGSNKPTFERKNYLQRDGASTSGAKEYTAEFAGRRTETWLLKTHVPDPKSTWDEAYASLDIGTARYMDVMKPIVHDDKLYQPLEEEALPLKKSLTDIDRNIAKQRLKEIDEKEASFDLLYGDVDDEYEEWLQPLYSDWAFVPREQRGQIYKLFAGVPKFLKKEDLAIKDPDIDPSRDYSYIAMYNKESPKQVIGFFAVAGFHDGDDGYSCAALVYSPIDKADYTYLEEECE